jgi:hypothetical protein
MRKIKTIFVLILVTSIWLLPAGQLMVNVSANVLKPNDEGYRDTYGNSLFYPELKLGYKVMQDFYLWGGFGYLSVNGTTIGDLQLDSKSTQTILSLGIGYNGKLGKSLDYMLELGACSFNYKEEAMDMEISDSAIGFRVDGTLAYCLGKGFYAGLVLGYMTASDTIKFEGVNYDIKLGGLKAGIVLGIKL